MKLKSKVEIIIIIIIIIITVNFLPSWCNLYHSEWMAASVECDLPTKSQQLTMNTGIPEL